MGVCIQSLPPELLLHIFYIGCKETTIFPTTECIPRKRRPLIHLARQICSQWRTTLDHPVCLGDPHFWVAHLALQLKDEDAKPFKRYESNPHDNQPFVKRPIKFRHCLTTSEGCDLEISIFLPISNDWNCNFEEYSPDAALTLRLLLYGLQLVIPYQNQVTRIEMTGKVPLAWGQFMTLIMTEFRSAHILEEVHLMPRAFFSHLPQRMSEVPQSIPELMNLARAAGFRELHPNSINQTQLPLSMKHLPGLNRLVLPYVMWLSTGGLKLDLPISHLEIGVCPSPNLLVELLGTQPILLNNLITLTVDFHGNAAIPPDEQENIPSRPPSSIRLPRLMSISLASVYTSWAIFFFKYARAPLLEYARIDCSGTESEELMETLGAAEDMADNTPTLSASLLALVIRIDISRGSLKLLKMLASSSVESLRFRIYQSRVFKSQEDDLQNISQMAKVLSRFKPYSLYVDETSRSVTQFILRCINPHRLRSLGVVGGRDNVWTPQRSALIARFLRRQEFPITLPVLADVRLEGEKNFYQFLKSISANVLRSVSLSINGNPKYYRHYSSADSTPFTQLLSVEAVIITACDPDLPDIWKIVPNVRSLDISIRSAVSKSDVVTTHLMGYITSTIGLLTPKTQHTLLCLQSFSLTYQINSYQVDLKELFQFTSLHGQLHDNIKKVLDTREEFGAIPLRLKSIRLNKMPFDNYKLMIIIEA